MTYEQLTNIFIASHILPWESDYYWAYFDAPADQVAISTKAYEEIEDLTMFFCTVRGNNAYIIVPKGTVIPEDFLENIEQITEVPTEPPVSEEITEVPTEPPVSEEPTTSE